MQQDSKSSKSLVRFWAWGTSGKTYLHRTSGLQGGEC